MRVKLEDVCMRGFSGLKQSDVVVGAGQYPVYGAAGLINNVDFYQQEKPYVAVVKDGAGIGRAGLYPAYSSVIGTMQYLIPKNNVLPEYLFYVVKYMHLEKYFSGATIPHIYFKDYKNEEFNLEAIEKQRAIVDILGKVEHIIQNRKKQMDRLDTLTKSRFVEMFGDVSIGKFNYPTQKLGKVSIVGSSHRVFTNEFVDVGIPFYRGTEIGELANGDRPSNPYYISEEHYNRIASDETKPQIGDILLPSICNKGQVWMVDNENPFYYKDGRVLSVRPDTRLFNPKFLQCFLKEKTLIEYPKMGSGSTFAEFKIFLLKDLNVPIPPLELQNEFAAFVAQIDKSRDAIQKSLDETQLLFDSLMQEYFG